jgi:hypothetical protein
MIIKNEPSHATIPLWPIDITYNYRNHQDGLRESVLYSPVRTAEKLRLVSSICIF